MRTDPPRPNIGSVSMSLCLCACILTGCGFGGAPSASDIKEALGYSKVDNLTCIEAKDAMGGYVCNFITERSGLLGAMARFKYEGGSWHVYSR